MIGVIVCGYWFGKPLEALSDWAELHNTYTYDDDRVNTNKITPDREEKGSQPRRGPPTSRSFTKPISENSVATWSRSEYRICKREIIIIIIINFIIATSRSCSTFRSFFLTFFYVSLSLARSDDESSRHCCKVPARPGLPSKMMTSLKGEESTTQRMRVLALTLSKAVKYCKKRGSSRACRAEQREEENEFDPSLSLSAAVMTSRALSFSFSSAQSPPHFSAQVPDIN